MIANWTPNNEFDEGNVFIKQQDASFSSWYLIQGFKIPKPFMYVNLLFHETLTVLKNTLWAEKEFL